MAQLMRGASGRLIVGGREAATLGDWTMEARAVGGCDIVAKVAARDDYWMQSGAGFSLTLDIGKHARTWRDVVVHDNGALVNIKTREA